MCFIYYEQVFHDDFIQKDTYPMFETIDNAFLETCQEKMAANKDPSHDWGHVKDVARAAFHMARYAGIELQPLLLAAISHDTYSGIDRVNHHLLSGAWVRENLPFTLHGEWTETVALCCEQHRASYRGEYTSIYQEAFASADRGMLKMDSINEIVKRSYNFSYARTGNHEQAVDQAAYHMPEKYGHNGYAKWPELYRKVFATELIALKDSADSMTVDRVNQILGVSK